MFSLKRAMCTLNTLRTVLPISTNWIIIAVMLTAACDSNEMQLWVSQSSNYSRLGVVTYILTFVFFLGQTF